MTSTSGASQSQPQGQLQNIYHLRTVADTSAKSCMVCYKPSTKVLITPDNRDFFYICTGHLTDRGFASAIIDEAEAAEKKRAAELANEIELIKKEYEEKMKAKKAKKDKDKDKDKDIDKKKVADAEAEKLEKEKDEKIKAATAGSAGSGSGATGAAGGTGAIAEDIPRIYALHRNFFQMRLTKIRNAEIAKRNRERGKDPLAFPSVPTGGL